MSTQKLQDCQKIYSETDISNITKDIFNGHVYKYVSNKRLHSIIGLYYHNRHNYKLAIKYYKSANDVQSTANLGYLYYSLGQMTNAVKYYNNAILLGDIDSMYNLAVLYEESNNIQLAIKYYTITADSYNMPHSMHNVARLYVQKGNISMAKHYYAMAVSYNIVYAMYNLALLYYAENDLEWAKYYYNMAITYGYVPAIQGLAILYYNDGNISMAIEYCIKGIEHDDIDGLRAIYIILSENTGYTHEFTEANIMSFIKFGKQTKLHRKQLIYYKSVFNIFDWYEIQVGLGILTLDASTTPSVVKYLHTSLKNNYKLDICDICATDNPVKLIAIYSCNHFVCVSCYKKLYNKPCPYCRYTDKS